MGFLVVVLSFGTLLVLSVVQHQRSAATLRLLHEGYIPLASNLTELRALEDNAHISLQNAADDPGGQLRWLSGILRGRENELREALLDADRSEPLVLVAADRATLLGTRAALVETATEYEAFEPELEALVEAVEAGDRDRVEALVSALRVRQGRINRNVRGALEALDQRIADTSREAADAEARSVQTFAAFGLVALLSGILITWWARRLLAPLAALEARVLAVARGDLSRKIVPARDDEIGRLGEEFERMVAALSARDQRLRELQRTQDEIVASLRSGVLVVDATRHVRATNRAAAAIFGEEAAQIGVDLGAALEALPALSDAIDEVARTGAPAVREALPMADGKSVDLRVAPFGEAGASGTVLAVIDDVSEALATKARLIQSERLAAMGRMAAHVTHEVRNPLSSIGLNVELLQEEVRGAEAEGLLRSIQREIDRLTAFTEEYLRLARLPSPVLVAEPIEGVVRATTRFVEREMDAANIELTVELEPNLGVVLHDEAQIRQALLNLIRNAREAMPAGGTIDVRASHDGAGVALSVADRGEGIPAETRARIFDVFFSTKERGTGLGLALTREIVMAHHGEVRCEGRPGGGTVFTLWLPRTQEREERAA